MFKVSRTTSDSNTLRKLANPNQHLKIMQKQDNKHRFLISMLNNIFGQHFNVFYVFVDTLDNLIKLFLLDGTEPL